MISKVLILVAFVACANAVIYPATSYSNVVRPGYSNGVYGDGYSNGVYGNGYSNGVYGNGYSNGVYGNGYEGPIASGLISPYAGYGTYGANAYGYGAGLGPYGYGKGAHAPIYENNNYGSYPKYQYGYGVNDPYTGDHKSQQEIRDGDVVKGYYTVADPDGTLRTVHYTADDHNGFNAVVQRQGQAIHPTVYGNDGYGAYNAAPYGDYKNYNEYY